MDIADRIYDLLKKGLTHREFASLMGKSESEISRWLTGPHGFTTATLAKDTKFIEEDGRKVFLTYLRPIINGVGNYYIEAQTRDHDRMDVVVDYLGKRYVIELKIWRGNAYNERGEEQLTGYLERFNLQTGYLLSFCFNRNKQPGLLPPVQLNGRTLIEAIA